ncbi:hypothetical protein BST92_05505 [Nonlabens arenilitoris]|uniref:M23ase beta-sheet core domain-containing protein n=1 Tax=Nonlabens arenilitoris TaxID=1217969 RepID=A0A2S7U918_9FLAO|nr:hypothetical protein BST92_05505 [Nonlabens arenilitoris]
MIAVTSCEKDEDLPILQKTVGHNLKMNIVSYETLKQSSLIAQNTQDILGYQNKSADSTGYGIQIDTSRIQLLESDFYKSYTFQVVQDSLERQQVLKNYVLTVYNDSTLYQFTIDYPVLQDGIYDINNAMARNYAGNRLYKNDVNGCGWNEIAVTSWQETCVETTCKGRDKHTVSQGATCTRWWGTSNGATRTCTGGWVTRCQSGGRTSHDPFGTDDNPGGSGPTDRNDSGEPDEIGTTPNDGDALDPVDDDDCYLVCQNNEKLDPEKCECIPEDCEYKTGYLHESAFTNSTATIGDNTTSSQDNFRNENGEIIDETNCDTGKIDSDSEVNVSGEKEERSYVKNDGTTALAFYYPIEYLDCPKGNSPTNKDYDSTKPCSDCDHGDPVLNPEIQEQLTVCGKKGGMYGKTRGVPSCNTQKHGGMDIANAQGNAVYAMFDGTASLATQTSGAGYYVIITSDYGDDKIKTMYFHLAENTRVTGDVKAGDIIGYQSNSGNLQNGIDEGTTESHVHIKVKLKQNGTSSYSAVDPLNYFKTIFNNTTGEVTTSGCD